MGMTISRRTFLTGGFAAAGATSVLWWNQTRRDIDDTRHVTVFKSPT